MRAADLITEKTHKEAIQPGAAKRGWVVFRLFGIPASQIKATNVVVSFLDVNDKKIFATNGYSRVKPGVEFKTDPLDVSLAGSENIFSEIKPAPITNGEWLPPELPPGCSNVIIFLGSNGQIYSRFMAQIDPKLGTKFQIKDVPSFLLSGLEDAPNYSPRQKEIWLKYDSLYNVGGTSIQYPVRPVIVNNRLYVEVEIPFSNERHKIVMRDAFDSKLQIPPRWDRNFSTNYDGLSGIYAYEIVNELTNPVLQVAYSAPNEVHVNGVFQVDAMSVLAAFNQQPQLIGQVSSDVGQGKCENRCVI